MRNGHTPGPWLLDGRTVYALNDEGCNRFSALVQDAHTPAAELSANARLISAAPELLEALELVQDCLVKCLTGGEVSANLAGKAIQQAATVIDKARGQ